MALIPEATTQRVTSPAQVTLALVAINVVVFGIELIAGEPFIERWAFTPADLTDFLSGDGSAFVLLTMLTSIFLHGGLGHLLGNMLFLWVFGQAIEQAFGPRLYLRFYLLTGLIATLSQYLADPASTIPNIGASGAIAGIMGAFLAVFPSSKVALFVWPLSIIIHRRLYVPAWLMLGAWFAGQLVSAWNASYGADDGGVAFFAHIGGFVAGFLLAPMSVRRAERVVP